MIEQEQLIKSCANIIIDTVINVIYADPHQWSKRPCETCKVITGILGKPFGCYRYQQAKSLQQENSG